MQNRDVQSEKKIDREINQCTILLKLFLRWKCRGSRRSLGTDPTRRASSGFGEGIASVIPGEAPTVPGSRSAGPMA